MNAGKLKGVRF